MESGEPSLLLAADGAHPRFHAAVDRGAAQHHFVHPVAPQHALEIVEGAAHRHAGDPAVRLRGVVVEEADRVHVPVLVGAHLAHQQAAERAGAVHQHAAAALVARGGHQPHRAERAARDHHRHVSRIGSSTSTPRWKPSNRYSSDATASTSSDPSPTPRTTAARSRSPNVSHDR